MLKVFQKRFEVRRRVSEALLDLGWGVQRWVKFNPGLSKNYSRNYLSKEKITVLIKYCVDFHRKKLVNSKFTGQFRL